MSRSSSRDKEPSRRPAPAIRRERECLFKDCAPGETHNKAVHNYYYLRAKGTTRRLVSRHNDFRPHLFRFRGPPASPRLLVDHQRRRIASAFKCSRHLALFFPPLGPRARPPTGMVAHAKLCIVRPIIIVRAPMPNGIQGQHTSLLQNPRPPWTVNGCIHSPVDALEAVAKASHQNLTHLCPLHGKTLLHGHRTREVDGVGGITFGLIRGGDIQTPGCCQKFTTTPAPWGQRCLQSERRAVV